MTDRLAIARSNRIGIEGYLRLLVAVREAPLTSVEVSERTCVHVDLVRRVLRQMRDAGLVHREQWFRPNPKSRMLPRWGFGAAGDVPQPGWRDPRATRIRSTHLVTLLTVIEVLKEGPTRADDLAAEVGMHRYSVYRVIALLRENRLCRVAKWERGAIGAPALLFEFCEVWRPDAGKQKREPIAQQRKRWKATHHAKRAHLEMLQAFGAAVPQQAAA